MTRSIKDFNKEMATKGYTLNADFSFSRLRGSTCIKVTHYWRYKEGVSTCHPFQAVKYFNAPKKIEHWLDDITKFYHRTVTEQDVEEFFAIWNKKLTACGIDPDTVVCVGGDERIC